MSAQIEVKNLRKTFYTNGIENEVLKGINLTIQKGKSSESLDLAARGNLLWPGVSIIWRHRMTGRFMWMA